MKKSPIITKLIKKIMARLEKAALVPGEAL